MSICRPGCIGEKFVLKLLKIFSSAEIHGYVSQNGLRCSLYCVVEIFPVIEHGRDISLVGSGVTKQARKLSQ